MTTIRELQQSAHENAVSKGWWDSHPIEDEKRVMSPDELLAKLMLITTEVAEAAEDVRKGGLCMVTFARGKPEGFPTELADIIIRCLDLAGAMNIDLHSEVVRKMEYNKTRKRMHGGKLA